MFLAADGKLRLFVSPFILSELADVLGRAKIGFSPEQVHAAVEAIKEVAAIVHPKVREDIIQKDKSDNRILECALAAEADALVTGNMEDIRPLGKFRNIEILTPREFLDRFFPDEAYLTNLTNEASS